MGMTDLENETYIFWDLALTFEQRAREAKPTDDLIDDIDTMGVMTYSPAIRSRCCRLIYRHATAGREPGVAQEG